MNADHEPGSFLEPLPDRVPELSESRPAAQARGHRDEQAADAMLADIGRLMPALRACRVTDAGGLPAPAAERQASDGDAMISLLDMVATAALISRSSLGTPAASRIRRETPPGRIADILQRRDRLAAENEDPGQPGIPETAPAPQGVPADPGGMACSEVLDSVYYFLDGELSEENCEKVRQHLDACGPCLREYCLDEAVKRLVSRHGGDDPAPVGLRAKVLARIRQINAAMEAL